VISELKKNSGRSESADELEIEIRTDAEADEVWSYVGKKQNQRWTWHTVERNTGVILAWRNGRRTVSGKSG